MVNLPMLLVWIVLVLLAILRNVAEWRSLPAATDSRQSCEDKQPDLGAIIYWWNPLDCEKEYEEFASMAEAMAELEVWKQRFPWNTYGIAKTVLSHKATA